MTWTSHATFPCLLFGNATPSECTGSIRIKLGYGAAIQPCTAPKFPAPFPQDIPKERVVRLGRGYDETDPRIREVAFSDPGRARQQSGTIKGKKFKEIMRNLENAKSNIERVFKLADEARCLSLEGLWGTFKDEQKIDFKQNHGLKTSYLASKMREIIPLDGLKEWAKGLKEWLIAESEEGEGSDEGVIYWEDERNR